VGIRGWISDTNGYADLVGFAGFVRTRPSLGSGTMERSRVTSAGINRPVGQLHIAGGTGAGVG
jgi:hypothetical protein